MARRPDAWLARTADPEGAALEQALEELVERLELARRAAERIAGARALGLREVELAPGVRNYLCAFEGPAFVCLTGTGTPVNDAHVVHRVATISLVWEQLEADVDPSRLGDVAAAAARVLAATDAVPMTEAVAETAEHAVAIRAWRESPLRAVASRWPTRTSSSPAAVASAPRRASRRSRSSRRCWAGRSAARGR